MIRRVMALLALIFTLAPISPAQSGEAQVKALLSTGVVKLGDRAQIIVVVQDARDARILEVPQVEGLRIGQPSRPSVSESYRSINGRTTRSRTLKYGIVLRPDKKGDYVIPPIKVSVDGREVMTSRMQLTVVEDLKGEELGYIEFVEVPERVYEGEVFTLELRFGWDQKLGGINWADLRLPWWKNLPGLLEVESDDPNLAGGLITVNLNTDSEIDVRALPAGPIKGRAFRLFALRRRFIATRSGTLEVPKSFLEFAEVESAGPFGSQRRKTQSYFVAEAPRTIEVLPLPSEGRPLDFSNGVGRFHARAMVDRWDVDVGDSIKVTVEWSGKGNLEFFEPPDLSRLDAFEGDFRFYGIARDDFLTDRRVVTFDIAPVSSEVDKIPAIPLVVFDTESGEYMTVSTDPIDVRVRALEDASSLVGEGGADRGYDIRDIQPGDAPAQADSRIGPWPILLTMMIGPLLWIGLRTAVRRNGDPDSPERRRRRKARKNLQKNLRGAKTASEQARALYDFLGARTREGAPAWEGRDVVAFLTRGEESIAEAESRELAQLVEKLDASTYAGNDQPVAEAEIVSVVDRLMKAGV